MTLLRMACIYCVRTKGMPTLVRRQISYVSYDMICLLGLPTQLNREKVKNVAVFINLIFTFYFLEYKLDFISNLR